MKEFWVLFDRGDDQPASRLRVFSESLQRVRESFPNAVRILAV